MSALVEMQGVAKSVGGPAGRVWLLRQINLTIREGEFVTIMGPSGAGKSTLLHVIGLLDSEFEGDYRFDGESVREASPKRRAELHRKEVGFVFQQYHLLDDLTVAENLEVPLSYRGVGRAERQAVVADALDRFGIVGKKDLFPRQLSGGQQQLVGVARAVILKPRLLLADEPTGNLHSDQGREIMSLFRKLHDAGTTIVQVTHSAENAAWGERIVELRDGMIVGDRRIDEKARAS